MAAFAILTVLGLLVSSVIQRQVRLYLRTHAQQLPGNKGLTSTPTAYDLLVCDALGLDSSWYEASSAKKTARTFRPLERGSYGESSATPAFSLIHDARS
jgi:hypothetical protein